MASINNNIGLHSPIVVLQYDHLPNYKVATLKSTQSIQVDGDRDEPYLSTRSVSTYPILPCGEKDGDPIADKLFVQVHRNRAVLAIADGCNWGKRPANAARDAITAFSNYFNQRQDEITTLQDAGHFLLRAFCEAHNKIVEGKNDIWDAGTTTLLGGLVLELDTQEEGAPKWGFLCASVGDCKAFLVSHKKKEALDVTNGNRCNLSDTRDPGGRLGPYVGQGWPDLRNLKLYFSFCEENDIALIMSDGVHDNLDPIMLGKAPSDLNINAKGWEELNQDELLKAKTSFMKSLIEELVFEQQQSNLNNSSNSNSTIPVNGSSSSNVEQNGKSHKKIINPIDITSKLIDHCSKTTHRARDFMEKYPNKRQPNDYKEFPGKMDHSTCVTFQIGHSK
ncbi:protein phosphatase 2C-related protein [Tieghemostelium lacteum]|uniref:Protein phosphatase 2C-related protein n=1 Tax=Tieghemostelium lacteum TaxID=361077 RepID=A0A152A924_TIELA|nr:protein phosphatase 2C-related protein [Tieghemostelium lacteum]|eukprot:KYR02720.1 protein phosphatase 2C-related protein [Tieghemostelium lacteum]